MLQKGSKVRILRKESYWFNKVGVVISVEKSNVIRYPVVVRFEGARHHPCSGCSSPYRVHPRRRWPAWRALCARMHVQVV